MGDIRSPRLLYLKGALLFGAGLTAAISLLIEHPGLKFALLLALAIWAFARSYYFAFYVIEHYIDGDYKYSGLFSFLCYAFRRRGYHGPSGEPPGGIAEAAAYPGGTHQEQTASKRIE
jgi:hypothetical protein